MTEPKDSTETASRWVWLIAILAMKLPYPREKPRVGDIVVETTHLFSLAQHRIGLHKAVGELLEIDKDKNGQPAYLIKSIDPYVGKTWWVNADITVIERCD